MTSFRKCKKNFNVDTIVISSCNQQINILPPCVQLSSLVGVIIIAAWSMMVSQQWQTTLILRIDLTRLIPLCPTLPCSCWSFYLFTPVLDKPSYQAFELECDLSQSYPYQWLGYNWVKLKLWTDDGCCTKT